MLANETNSEKLFPIDSYEHISSNSLRLVFERAGQLGQSCSLPNQNIKSISAWYYKCVFGNSIETATYHIYVKRNIYEEKT